MPLLKTFSNLATTRDGNPNRHNLLLRKLFSVRRFQNVVAASQLHIHLEGNVGAVRLGVTTAHLACQHNLTGESIPRVRFNLHVLIQLVVHCLENKHQLALIASALSYCFFENLAWIAWISQVYPRAHIRNTHTVFPCQLDKVLYKSLHMAQFETVIKIDHSPVRQINVGFVEGVAAHIPATILWAQHKSPEPIRGLSQAVHEKRRSQQTRLHLNKGAVHIKPEHFQNPVVIVDMLVHLFQLVKRNMRPDILDLEPLTLLLPGQWLLIVLTSDDPDHLHRSPDFSLVWHTRIHALEVGEA
mmetsp:Transcript_14293/g.24527  ORF Transcript_14293/g.24527 Transcript_14293/m.24527 type:complete len:300 (-) Transcript_14293:1147-2046(-)